MICYKLQKHFKKIDIWQGEFNYFNNKSNKAKVKTIRNSNKIYFNNKKLA